MRCENGIVVFEPEVFKETFPEFAEMADERLNVYFAYATKIINNSRCSIVPCRERVEYYNLIIAHFTELQMRGMSLAGTIATASQGSVSLGISQVSLGSNSGPWTQTQWGAMLWDMLAKYRGLVYIPR